METSVYFVIHIIHIDCKNAKINGLYKKIGFKLKIYSYCIMEERRSEEYKGEEHRGEERRMESVQEAVRTENSLSGFLKKEIDIMGHKVKMWILLLVLGAVLYYMYANGMLDKLGLKQFKLSGVNLNTVGSESFGTPSAVRTTLRGGFRHY